MPLPRLADLQADLAHKTRCAKELVDKAAKEERLLSKEENEVFDGIIKDVNDLKARIKDLEHDQSQRTRLDDVMKELDAPQGRRTSADAPARTEAPANERTSFSIPAVAKRTGSLKAFKGPHAEERAYRSGMWARAILFNDQKAAHYCSVQGIFKSGMTNAMSEGSNPAGGYLVPEEFSQAIIDLREIFGVFRQNVHVVPMGSDTMLIPRRAGGLTVAFVGENSEIGDSTPAWDQVRLVAKKLAGLVKMSSEVDEDAVINLADWLAAEFAYAFALKEDQCGFNGDGTSLYGGIRGICNILVGGSGLVGAVDAASGHDTFAEIDAGDLGRVMGALPAYARMNAKWYVSSVGMDVMFGRLMAAGGGNNIQDIERGYTPRYLGHPIVLSQVLPTSQGDLSDVPMLLFGDLGKSSTMGDRRGISIMPSAHRYMELDQIALRATERFDIVNHDLGDTAVAGPLVALVGE